MMEERGSNIIQMSVKSKQALSLFVIPNLDFVIISARDEQGLILMKINTTNGTLVFFEFINKSTGSVIPKIYNASVETCQYPRSLWVKSQAYEKNTQEINDVMKSLENYVSSEVIPFTLAEDESNLAR